MNAALQILQSILQACRIGLGEEVDAGHLELASSAVQHHEQLSFVMFLQLVPSAVESLLNLALLHSDGAADPWYHLSRLAPIERVIV